jgi:hypothetical protein
MSRPMGRHSVVVPSVNANDVHDRDRTASANLSPSPSPMNPHLTTRQTFLADDKYNRLKKASKSDYPSFSKNVESKD